ncbi:2TM domain-containing protein [Chroococcidiopsis sp. FACHB-1243]|uniref:2TM domain-containing protein n=1 Tax=Chroococcidiopsis sp. [FACHB-1243] TaxID=2692781 RepID=UPI00178566D4|nr:2TM domain-containing protein [Chroococcidiopsis sp. [FACHB-1243]]MBD2308142.1 2TM domain-containing protein [Chroococcidiopsis sp. [FACHB-1243]]
MKTVVDNKLVRTYHQEDIQQILQIAIARQAYEGEFSRQQLLEIAAELEISSECLQLAEQEWLTQQSDSQERQKFNLDRRKRLQKRFGNYGLVNIFFILLDLVSGGGLSWSLYILLSLSFLLGLDVWNKSQIQGEEYEKAFQNWKRRHQIKRSINSLLDRLLKA